MNKIDEISEEAGKSLSEAVFGQLKSDIILGVLEPGSRLPFNLLQERYQVGTSPLREALSRLAADRLVRQETNRGFRVSPISLADFEDIATVRRDIECKAVAASVARGDNEWEERLIVAHHRLGRLVRDKRAFPKSGVSGEWERCHRAFHMALIAACGSEWTLHFCGLLHDQFDRYRRLVGTSSNAQAPLGQYHDMLLEAALGRDADEAARILAEHIDKTAEMVLAHLAGGNARPRRRAKRRAQTIVPPSTSRS